MVNRLNMFWQRSKLSLIEIILTVGGSLLHRESLYQGLNLYMPAESLEDHTVMALKESTEGVQ